MPPLLLKSLCVAAGAVGGAWLRWLLAARFNHLSAALPLGTLAANLSGCLLIGIVLALNLPEHWKLLLTTGFLGSLTTFSTFAAELSQRFGAQDWSGAALMLAAHIGGGTAAVMLGAMLARLLQNAT